MEKEEIKQCLIDSFDFKKVWKVMLATDMRWSYPDGRETPTIAEMKERVSKLFDELFSSDGIYEVSSGGFRVYLESTNNDDVFSSVKLDFVLETSSFFFETEM